MPSYIELDQNATFPNASGPGKVVFGINALGAAVVVDDNGNTLMLSQSAATGSGIFSGSFYGDGSGLTNVPGTGGGSADGNLILSFVSSSIGPKVTFTKTNYGTEIDYLTSGSMEITRGNNKGIYNKAKEIDYNKDTNTAPSGSEWNSQNTDSVNYGWSNLGNLSSRTYDTWYSATDLPYDIGEELVMRDTINNKYYLIKFTQWTAGGAGGGFAYERYEIFQSSSFTRPPNSPTTVDTIVSGSLVIKRDNTNNGIYNSILETQWDDNAGMSPLGTEWNSIDIDPVRYGWGNLSNIRSRRYGKWNQAYNSTPGRELVMHDTINDAFYKVKFTSYNEGDSNGAFSYTRELIPENEVIIYPDKSVQRTAGLPVYPSITIATNGTHSLAEPGVHQITTSFTGSLLFPDPNTLQGQTMVIVNMAGAPIYTICDNGGIINIGNASVTSVDSYKTTTFMAVGNYWIQIGVTS
jgi:hypothetical protein